MNSTLRSPLVILDREIGHNEPWMLTPYAGYVRLTPALGDASTCGDTGRGDVLLLSDVGYLEGVHEASSVETPSLRPSLEGGCGDVVLLVPSDLMATLSSMSRLARQSAPAIDDLEEPTQRPDIVLPAVGLDERVDSADLSNTDT